MTSLADDCRALKRKTLLINAGHRTETRINAILVECYSVQDSIEFNAKAIELDIIINSYFQDVQAFKESHEFRDGDLINFSKIAGLFTVILLSRRDAPLFLIPDSLKSSAVAALTVPLFIYTLIGSILSLDTTKIDPEVENDLLRCLTLHPDIRIDSDWLFWSLKVLQIAYGDPALSAP